MKSSSIKEIKERKPSDWKRDLRELAKPIPVNRGEEVSGHDVNFVHDCRILLKRRRKGGYGWIAWLSILVVASLLWWASWAELEEVTRGIGKVIPSKSVQLIQSLEGGILEKIYVEEGEQVEEGQSLLRIQDAIFAANYAENQSRREGLVTRLSRLSAEIEVFGTLNFPAETPERLQAIETRLFEKRKADYLATERALRARSALARDEEALIEAGHARKAVSPVDLIRIQKEVAELEGQISTLLTNFEREAMEQYDVGNAELRSLEHALKRDKDRLDRTVIKSVVRGTVNKIHIKTVGGVIGSGVDIMEVVPLGDSLLIEANIRPADIAFIRPGQKAKVKFTAYDFAVYGGLDGTVENLSVDTITNEEGESFYQVKVRTELKSLGKDKDGKELPIMPGMVTEVDVMTGKKTVLAYLLRPVLRAKERALRER